MKTAKTMPFEDWVLYITNHFTHSVVAAQAASPRYHLARKLSEKGQKLLVYCPIGRHVGNPFRDFVTNLFPKKTASGNTVYLFPPLIVSPASATTPMTLVMGAFFILVYLTLTRIQVAAQYSTTMLVASVGAVIWSRKKIPMVANYGDPDFARERGLARRAFGFCENLVLSRETAHAVVYVDEVIGDYVRKEFGVRRAVFLPNGGYEEGFSPPEPDDPQVISLRHELRLEGKTIVIYAGQVSNGYRVDLLVPAASVIIESMPEVVFLVIGDGSALQSVISQAKRSGLTESFRFMGEVPYAKIGAYLAMSQVGLQLLNDMCMGTKVLMYMSYNVPVVSTGSWFGRYHEFLKNGENSILIPPNDEVLASSVSELLRNPALRQRLREQAWIAASEYSWDTHAEVTLMLLREAAGQTSRDKSVHMIQPRGQSW
jgi:glycosyltransferase involved in cell wall biosynthesis